MVVNPLPWTTKLLEESSRSDPGMVDYTVPVEDSDYTISENARSELTEEVMIQWFLAMDGVLNEEEIENC